MKQTKLFLTVLAGTIAANYNPAAAAPAPVPAQEILAEDHAAVFASARKLMAKQKYAAAVPVLRSLLEQTPGNKQVAAEYITALARAGNTSAAATVFARTGKIALPADTVYLLGTAYAGQGNWEKALDLYRDAAAGGYAKARVGEAECLAALGRSDEAEAAYTALLAADPADDWLYQQRGAIYLGRKQYDKAAADFSAAVLLKNKQGAASGALSESLAAALVGTGSYDEAVQVLSPLIKNKQATAAARVNYITAMGRSGNAALAIEEAKTMWPELAKVPVDGILALADCYVRTGYAAEALSLYQAALQREPGNLAGRAGQAYALLYSGRYVEGVKLYADTLKAAPYLAPNAVEDATALLAQGNLLGGRTLFEKTVAMFPQNPEYRQAYTRALAVYAPGHAAVKVPKAPAVAGKSTTNAVLAASANNTTVDKTTNVVVTADRTATVNTAKDTNSSTVASQVGQQYTDPAERSKLHEQAVTLGRNANYSESLAIFRLLYQANPADLKVTYDYITVLAWAGSTESAVELYEKLPKGAEVPDYVMRNVGSAYYQTGNYRKAHDIFAKLAAGGDKQARIWQAESLMRLSDPQAAQAIYEDLLRQDPYDLDVYLSRANMYYLAGEYANAVADFDKAQKITKTKPQYAQRETEIQGQFAAALINAGQPDKAVQVLKPFIIKGTATLNMQGDYLLALRNHGKYRQAVMEAKHIWPDYGKAPVFGLRALIDCHIQLKEYGQAVKIYEHVLSRDPNDNNAQFGMAFAMMFDGQVVQSLAIYDKLLTLSPANAPLVLRDAETLMTGQYYTQGKSLFELVIRRFPDQPVYRLRYAEALADNDLPRAAYKQFAALGAWPEYEKASLMGMGRMAYEMGEYDNLRRITGQIEAKYGRSSAVAAMQSFNQERQRGEINASFVYNSSYKQKRYWEQKISAEQSIGENLRVLAGVGRLRLDDTATKERITMDSMSIGLRQSNPELDWRVMFTKDKTNWNRIYRLEGSVDFHLSDQATISLSGKSEPVLDVQALKPANGGPILAKNYGITYSYRVSRNENYSVTFSKGSLSDGNKISGFNFDHSYLLYDRDHQSLTRYLFWSRNRWKWTRDYYESPSLRDMGGVAWAWRKTMPMSYWQYATYLAWGKDNPESYNFQPFFRVEYGVNFSANHALTVAAEYGLHSDNFTGKNLRASYRQYEILYRVTW